MWLSELQADRLRNLKAVSLRLSAGLTVVVGRNGQGKTSLLEAMYLLATGRSFRTQRAEELVSWDGGPLRVAGVVDGRLGRTRLAVTIDGPSRHLVADGAECELGAYFGRVDLIDLTGERMKVLRGGPEERRRFLDRGIVGLQPSYLERLGAFRRVLLQRNALLRRAPEREGARELESWDERLTIAAAQLHVERRRYAVLLGAGLGRFARALFPEEQELTLVYQPSPAGAAEVGAERFREIYAHSLVRSRTRDVACGHTCLGPHRDELLVELDRVDLRRFGSAGQVRAAMIALKLAKLSLLREERGEAPLFLMDDFDSDLDEVRGSALAGFLHDGGFQAVVASSKETLIGRLGVACTRLRMDDGVAKAA